MIKALYKLENGSRQIRLYAGRLAQRSLNSLEIASLKWSLNNGWYICHDNGRSVCKPASLLAGGFYDDRENNTSW